MQKQCDGCKQTFEAKRSKRQFCSHKCHAESMRNLGLLNKTLGEVKNISKKQNAYVTIRNHARNVMARSGLERVCLKCGYNKHVEVAHIKAISEFDDSALISSINNLDNLIYLCPNCHWEHDHKLV